VPAMHLCFRRTGPLDFFPWQTWPGCSCERCSQAVVSSRRNVPLSVLMQVAMVPLFIPNFSPPGSFAGSRRGCSDRSPLHRPLFPPNVVSLLRNAGGSI
jgi:hypothetical protein